MFITVCLFAATSFEEGIVVNLNMGKQMYDVVVKFHF